MSDEKHVYEVTENAPIPTYEEATASSSHPVSRYGPQEVSDDAERQGLLGAASSSNSRSQPRRNGAYQAPSVQSVDGSDDEGLDDESDAAAAAGEDAALRREMEEMDIIDPEAAEASSARRNRLRRGFKKRFYQITDRLSSFHLPRIPWPTISFAWLTDRLPTIPEDYRPGWAILARLCGLILIISLVYVLVMTEIMPGAGGTFGSPFNPEWVRQQAQGGIETWRIEENLKYITGFDHAGGTKGSFALGQWIEGRFKDAHMDTFTHDEYWVYMNFPKKGGRRVAIVEPKEMVWEAQLEEGSAYKPPRPQTDAFHGLSKAGNVTGPLIYANYGSKEDFAWLKKNNINVQDSVVLVRYYGTESDRAMKIRNAQDAGAAGVLIYSDPAEDGFKKGWVWPSGPWRPEDSVQRGSVALTSWIAGDVLTPGIPSTKDAKRMPKDKNPALPTIPSLPLSWKNAQKLLQSLKGIGKEVPSPWAGGVPDVQWRTGDPNKSPKVNLQNFQDEDEKHYITNVFGSFIGIEDEAKKVIVGNHRDSWCFGAADPGSGTAVMLEVARVLGELRAQGWRPLRTIEFASWDAEEYNLIGSTEHVEANIDDLRANAIAYLNVDVGVTGSKLWASGSPIFSQPWRRALKRVEDPAHNITLNDIWNADKSSIGALGAGSDYVAFQDMAGCSSFDFGFSGPEHADMYHSCYETFDWVSRYIDPGFQYHTVLAQLWVLLILELSQEAIVPFKLDDYANWMKDEVHALAEWASRQNGAHEHFDRVLFNPLDEAVREFQKWAPAFHGWEDVWYNQVYGTGGFESPGLTFQRMGHNQRMNMFETHLLDLPKGKNDKEPHGIPGRDQYKHVIFGPDAFGSGYDAATFPFVRDAIMSGDWKLAKKQIHMTADTIRRAVKTLER